MTKEEFEKLNSENTEVIKCPICNKEFKSNKSMMTHLRQTQDAKHMKHPRSNFYPVKERKNEQSSNSI
jgi:uncharacterized C2H2 Zn-finger protein